MNRNTWLALFSIISTQVHSEPTIIQLPNATELQQVEQQFTQELQGKMQDWTALQMTRTETGQSVILQESPEQEKGRGLFQIYPTASYDALLQAPHSEDDSHTGEIARLFASQNAFRAVQWNTVSRHTPIVSSGDTADMAHLDNTYWQQFTRAFAIRYPQGRIVQIHGFAKNKRQSEEGSDSDMIVSAGHKTPPLWVEQTAICLAKQLPLVVSLYPRDVQELGGTTNAQSQLLQSLGYTGFIHIEMSMKARKLLLNDESARQHMIDCLKPN